MKKLFFKLIILLFLSSLIILLYWGTMNQKELFPGGGYLFSVIANLSEAYIASFIFFYVVQYYPWEKNSKTSKHEVMYLLLKLKFDIKNLILYLLNFSDYKFQENILDYDSRVELPKTINFDLTKRNVESLYIGSVCQYFNDPKTGICVATICIRKCIQNLKEFSNYHDDELVRILTDINDSELIESLEIGSRTDSLLKKVVDTRAYELNKLICHYRNLSHYMAVNFSDNDMDKINIMTKESQDFQRAYIEKVLNQIQNK